MLLNKQGLNMQPEITEADFFHCPNCNGFEFVSFVPDGKYSDEDVPYHLMVCGGCQTIIERESGRLWLEATGDLDNSIPGCPVCGQ